LVLLRKIERIAKFSFGDTAPAIIFIYEVIHMIVLYEVIDMGEIRVRIPQKMHKKLKQKAIEEDTTLKEIIIKALNEYLKKTYK
jgi:hypothetical protein